MSAETRTLLHDMDILFDRSTKRRLKLALLGSIGVALAEVVGLVLILPLMQLISGADDGGLLGYLRRLFGNPNRNTLSIIIACLVFSAFIIKAVLTIVFRWWMLGFINDQEARTSVVLLERYLAAPYWLHSQRNTAELVRNLNESVSQTYSNVVLGALGAASEVAAIAGVMLVLLILEPIPAIGAIVYVAVASYLFQRLIRARSRRAGVAVTDAAFHTYRTAFHALGGVKEIKVRRNAEHFIGEYEDSRLWFSSAKRSAAFLGDLPRYVLEVLFILGVALMTVLVFSRNPKDSALAVLGLFVAAGFRVLPSLVRLLASITAVRIGKRGLDLVLADLREIDGADRADSRIIAPIDFTEGIEFDRVSFRYPGFEDEVLHEVTFSVPAGHSVAVVGPSGAGKSTLIDVLLGLHRPSHGSVTVDGADIAAELSRWQRSIGLVPQDVYVLDDTLRANIAFGERADLIDDERLAEVVELAQLDDLVAQLPEGLLTTVGERGARLSGGQRQQLGIARALYPRPRLLVLDEATSALDNRTERRITETVNSLQGRLTIVVIAHRLSTVRHCDRLVFLNDGTIESIGTFDEVRNDNKTFAALVTLADVSNSDLLPTDPSFDRPDRIRV